MCVCAQFTQADWARHRSNSRYVRHVRTIPSSSIIQGLVPPVAVFTAVAFLFAVYNTEVPAPYTINVGLTPFATTASALSLLLVFRTNASYDRWWEARKVRIGNIRSSK